MSEALLTCIQSIQPGEGQPPQIAMTFATSHQPPLEPEMQFLRQLALHLPVPFMSTVSTLIETDCDKWSVPETYTHVPDTQFGGEEMEEAEVSIKKLDQLFHRGQVHPAQAYKLLQILTHYPHWEYVTNTYSSSKKPHLQPLSLQGLLVNEENFVDVALQFARGRNLIKGTLDTAFHRKFVQHMGKKKKSGFFQRERVQQKRGAQVAPTTRFYHPFDPESAADNLSPKVRRPHGVQH